MPSKNVNERIATYVGISAPETPKYMLTNNFLCDYFQKTENVTQEYSFEEFEKRGTLHTEDEANRESLEKAFNRFLKRYLGEETILEENSKLPAGRHYYFPILQDMLASSNITLRHMLIQLQRLDSRFDYSGFQKNLANYIFNDTSGINFILKILFHADDQNPAILKEPEIAGRETFWRMLSTTERVRMSRLGKQLNEDLNVLLTHEYFGNLDFYRRYNYLSILLTSYVIQYIITRKGSDVNIFCKGNPQDARLNGSIHRACCENYASIRSMFPDLLKKYYGEMIKEASGDSETFFMYANGEEVRLFDLEFNEFAEEILGRSNRGGNRIEYHDIVKAFALTEYEEMEITVDNFILRYIDLARSRKGSTLIKISSTLPTSGKQIDMIYPKSNAKQKFFAMSGSLAEFYVRLYLAGKDQPYDYLDNFLEHLQKRYHIVIAKPNGSGKSKIRLSAKEFIRNREAFLDTLSGVNCLIKLSDSGYVVTLPEEKGDFKLI